MFVFRSTCNKLFFYKHYQYLIRQRYGQTPFLDITRQTRLPLYGTTGWTKKEPMNIPES